MKSTILNIRNNKRQAFENVNGNIKKIFILTDKPMSYVNLTFITNESEIIYKVNLDQPLTVIYPWNFIDVQGRGVEYYSQGDIFLEVEGLVNDDEIKQVSIFYS